MALDGAELETFLRQPGVYQGTLMPGDVLLTPPAYIMFERVFQQPAWSVKRLAFPTKMPEFHKVAGCMDATAGSENAVRMLLCMTETIQGRRCYAPPAARQPRSASAAGAVAEEGAAPPAGGPAAAAAATLEERAPAIAPEEATETAAREAAEVEPAAATGQEQTAAPADSEPTAAADAPEEPATAAASAEKEKELATETAAPEEPATPSPAGEPAATAEMEEPAATPVTGPAAAAAATGEPAEPAEQPAELEEWLAAELEKEQARHQTQRHRSATTLPCIPCARSLAAWPAGGQSARDAGIVAALLCLAFGGRAGCDRQRALGRGWGQAGGRRAGRSGGRDQAGGRRWESRSGQDTTAATTSARPGRKEAAHALRGAQEMSGRGARTRGTSGSLSLDAGGRGGHWRQLEA